MDRKYLGLLLLLTTTSASAGAKRADYVIQISVDGLRPDAITNLGPADAPNFYRLRTEGIFTDNARTDYDYSVTLPNHTSQLTGRPVLDHFGTNSGHHWTMNADPGPVTLASNAGYYVAGAFDVAHDAGLSTALYATKSKFSLYDHSWDATNGAPDVSGVDNGRDKIDIALIANHDSPSVMTSLVGNLGPAGSAGTRTNYTFVHFDDPDTAGHANGWDVSAASTPYMQAVETVDGYLGELFGMIAATPELNGHTTILLTSDHGGGLASGTDADHSDPTTPFDYTIPFYAWGSGVTPGDLYQANLVSRFDPGTGRPLYKDVGQPIRNGDIGNLSLDLLGLGAIPGSSINAGQTLAVPEPGALGLIGIAGLLVARCRNSKRLL